MRFLLALCALLFAAPASAATYSYVYEARWRTGSEFWDLAGQTKQLFQQGVLGAISFNSDDIYGGGWIDESDVYCDMWLYDCAGLKVSSYSRNSLHADYLMSGQTAEITLTATGGTFYYVCDCVYDRDDYDIRFGEFWLDLTPVAALTGVTEVPLPASAWLLLAGVMSILGMRRRRDC